MKTLHVKTLKSVIKLSQPGDKQVANTSKRDFVGYKPPLHRNVVSDLKLASIVKAIIRSYL